MADRDTDSILTDETWNSGMRSPNASSDSDAGYVAFWHDDLRGYPLDIHDIYDDWPSNPPVGYPSSRTSSRASSLDPRTRQFRSLYNLELLDRQRPLDVASTLGPGADLGVLRKRWHRRFQQGSNGDWNYVEYVPAWTDPDWDERYVWTGTNAPAWPADHPLAKQYAKPGLMQTLRPALRDSDNVLNPSAVAKRWGIYPYRTGQTQLNGSSGLTPTQPGFPTVPLDIPTWSYAKNQVWLEVTIDDLKAARNDYDLQMQAANREASDEGFRWYLEDTANSVPRGSETWDQADKMVQLFDLCVEQERREEYQHMLFSGNTTNEVRMSGYELVLSIFG